VTQALSKHKSNSGAAGLVLVFLVAIYDFDHSSSLFEVQPPPNSTPVTGELSSGRHAPRSRNPKAGFFELEILELFSQAGENPKALGFQPESKEPSFTLGVKRSDE
jgi:hypothetical protein